VQVQAVEDKEPHSLLEEMMDSKVSEAKDSVDTDSAAKANKEDSGASQDSEEDSLEASQVRVDPKAKDREEPLIQMATRKNKLYITRN
jgi:hypothetical protein